MSMLGVSGVIASGIWTSQLLFITTGGLHRNYLDPTADFTAQIPIFSRFPGASVSIDRLNHNGYTTHMEFI
jgi:hypothetical protein